MEISRHTHFYNLFYFKNLLSKRVALETETAEDCFNNKAIYTMKTLFFFFRSLFFLFVCFDLYFPSSRFL